MNLLLRAKHWQFFLLIIGSAILSEVATMFSLFFNLLFLGTLLGWMYSVAVGMQKMVPAAAKMKVILFKVFFFISVIYAIPILFFMDLYPKPFGDLFFGPHAVIIVPVHLFAIFCQFYCLYFVAKTIKTVELQRAVTFSDFSKEFFLAWFFPIGIWILQPKINRMMTLDANANDNVVTR